MASPVAPTAPSALSRRQFRAAAVALFLVHLAMLVALAHLLPWTKDEYSYLKAGALLRIERSWEVPHTTFHGPLPYFANQLAAWLGVVPVEPADAYLFWGRLGMLPFAVVAAAALLALARRLFDRRTALLALLLHILNPVVLANAPLVTTDTALAALSMLTLASAYATVQAPSPWRWLALGLAFGAALATKYLALFLLPVLGLWLLAAAWRADQPTWLGRRPPRSVVQRWLRLLIPALVLTAVVLLTLHTCYLWAVDCYVPPASGGPAPRSAAMRTLLSLPLVPDLLRLLPEPFVRGIDFQKMQSEGAGLTAMFDSVKLGHNSYFAVSAALKLPLVFLALCLLGAVRGARWPAHARSLLLLGIGLPFIYLSFFSVLQNGIRYLLPSVVLVTIVAARGAAWLAGRRMGRITLAVLAAALLACHGTTWPRYPSAFNVLAGSRPYLIFADANFDWSARVPADWLTMRSRYPDATIANTATGPAFGSFLVNGIELARTDPRDANRTYHWLRRMHPRQRLGPYCLFVVDEDAFAHADHAAAPRSRVELAVALLGRGDASAALTALAGNDDPDAPRARAVAEAMLRAEASGEATCQHLLDLGRQDLVAKPGSGATPVQRATAHWALGDMAAARQVLEAEASSRSLTPPEVNLLATVLVALHEHDAAIALLDRHAPPPGTPARAAFDGVRQMLVDSTRDWKRLLDR